MFFYRAIEKYGWENIQHIIIAENLTLKEANDMELKLINEYQTTNPQYGYNCHQGGNNHKVNEITRLKMSIAQQGENNNFYGHKHSDEHKKKMSLRQSGKNNSFYGKHHKPETIEKIRINSQGRKMSAELKEKLRLINLNRIVSEETKTKMRLSKVGAYLGAANPNAKTFQWKGIIFNCIKEFADYNGWKLRKASYYINLHKEEFEYINKSSNTN